MKPKFLVVFQKELTEAVRDRRNLAIVLLLGAMLPALLGFALHRLIANETRSEKEGIELVVIGAAQAPTLLAALRRENVTVSERGEMGDADITALLRQKTVSGVLKLSPRFADDYRAMRPARIELWFDSAGEKEAQRRDLEHILRQYSIEIAGARLLAHGVSPATLSPIQLQRYDTATGATRSNRIIGSMLGMLFIPAFVFGLSMVIDGTAGERERRSLEILMAQPARPFDLIAGKWLAASVLAVLGMSLELSAAHIMLKSLPLEEVGMSWRLSLPMLLSVIAVSVPLCLFATAIEIALAMNARTFKEAQTYIAPLTLAGVGVLAVAAALALRVTTMPDPRGEAIAVDRVEVSLGGRARAVLEPGAQLIGTATTSCRRTATSSIASSRGRASACTRRRATSRSRERASR